NTQPATVSATYASTLSAPNLALEVDGPLLGTGNLTLVGKTGDTILKDLWESNGGYGTVLLTQTSATIAGVSDPVFSGNVSVNGGVLELGAPNNVLGPNSGGTQSVTVASGAPVVFNGFTGAYT